MWDGSVQRARGRDSFKIQARREEKEAPIFKSCIEQCIIIVMVFQCGIQNSNFWRQFFRFRVKHVGFACLLGLNIKDLEQGISTGPCWINKPGPSNSMCDSERHISKCRVHKNHNCTCSLLIMFWRWIGRDWFWRIRASYNNAFLILKFC